MYQPQRKNYFKTQDELDRWLDSLESLSEGRKKQSIKRALDSGYITAKVKKKNATKNSDNSNKRDK